MIPNVLSIAGSDPSGGAGIQADLKTFAALGCHGMAAISALTAQNTRGVRAIHLPAAGFVAEQIEMIFADIPVAAVKIGMLGSADIAAAVARVLRARKGPPVVLDPVLVATSGANLGDDDVVTAMRQHLFPLARVITPNLPEASRLSGAAWPRTRDAVETMARALRGDGAAAWLLKGGHAGGDKAEDFLLDGDAALWVSSPRIATRNTHGTGCTLSAAIAAFLAENMPLETAVTEAKAYLDRTLAGADRLTVGGGPGPVDHFVDWRHGGSPPGR